MPDLNNKTPASPSFEKLIAKLRELFELDKADLDFGIYRVLRQRHTEITEFLDKHLEQTVREALQSHGSLQTVQTEAELHKAEQASQAAGIAAEQSPRVMQLREKLKAGADLDALADEVYSHLLTFFSRYYEGGDFLGLHRSTVHGREKYMIPYNGEEVKLVWANMDQYYIKSSELLRDYTFRIRKSELATGELPLNDLPDEAVIYFKLVEGDTEKDNRKPDGKTSRAFALDEEKAFEEADQTALTIRFRYREHTSERNLQDRLNADTEKTLADSLPPRWKALLFAIDSGYKGKDKKDTRTVLHKHLRNYTAKFLFDYFIHKDLGGFLRRELDFYMKNEVMHLDDIEGMTAPKAEEYLSKVRAIRRSALPVVRMLEQLENFQKKLWLKKKFVVETRYCVTLDRVPAALYPEIAANEAQLAEWQELYALSKADMGALKKQFEAKERIETFPMLDTRHFPREFTLKLLASIDKLDESLDGVCFHSENFQALQLMQERYREQVKCVYIDPPYNTGGDDFIYRDNYQFSSWLTMLSERIRLGRNTGKSNAAFLSSIDDSSAELLRAVFQTAYSRTGFMANFVWRRRVTSSMAKSWISSDHEYVSVFSNTPDAVEIAGLERDQSKYCIPDGKGGVYASMPLTVGMNRTQRPNQWFELKNPKTGKGYWPPANRIWGFYPPTMAKKVAEGRIIWPEDYPDRNMTTPRYKAYAEEAKRDRKPLSTWISEKGKGAKSETEEDDNGYALEVGKNEEGTRILKSFFGEVPPIFPKPLSLLQGLLQQFLGENGDTLDFFAGSGTTGHAVISLNREDNGERKYLLVEMGEYFNTLLVPRLKKVVYCTEWKEAKPQNRNTGISHAFKIVRLESYEDTLNNLNLHRTPEQEAALKKAEGWQRDEYLLGYFLDVESAGSKSLLDVGAFRDPFAYKLNIATASAGETKETPVDLIETFNWLIGLKVKNIDQQKGFLTVTGEKRAGGRTLILWRTLGADPKADNAALEKYLAKIVVNPADTEYEFIYVNGSHTLNDPHNKVHLVEEEFQRRMFDETSFESLS